MKTLEILDKGNAVYALTVTPSRLTIKLKAGASASEVNRVTLFFKQVANSVQLQNCTKSFRGRCDVVGDKPISIEMMDDRKNETHLFEETNNGNSFS